MRPNALLGFGSLALMLAATPALSADQKAPTYLLSMQMKDGNRLVGSPKLRIIAGKPARIEVGNVAGDYYTVSVTATPHSADTVTVASTINVVSAGARHAANPTLRVAFGKPATIEFGEDSPTSKPFRVDFKIDKAT